MPNTLIAAKAVDITFGRTVRERVAALITVE
jgi:hypothetical protein